MIIRNIDNCKTSSKNGEYGGASGLKEGVVIDDENWLVKYPKNAGYLSRSEELSYTLDPLSEYLGSHIYQILGYPAHETMLVERNNKICVACKDFVSKNQRLVEVRTLKNTMNKELAEILERDFSSTGSTHTVDFEEIKMHLNYNPALNKIPHIKDRFYDQIVIDAFINNTDRNNGNWGLLRTEKGDQLAPIYDNGGAFNGKTPDSRIKRLLQSEKSVKNSVTNGISVYGRNDTNINNKELLNYNISELKQALIRNVPLIKDNISKFKDLINDVPDNICSQTRKEFYIKSLELRLEFVLEPAYELAKQRQTMPTLVALCGVPGSGKTEYADRLKEDNPNFTVVSLTAELEKVIQSTGKRDITKALANVFDQIYYQLSQKHDVIYDAANLKTNHRKLILDEFRNINAIKEIHFLNVKKETALIKCIEQQTIITEDRLSQLINSINNNKPTINEGWDNVINITIPEIEITDELQNAIDNYYKETNIDNLLSDVIDEQDEININFDPADND